MLRTFFFILCWAACSHAQPAPAPVPTPWSPGGVLERAFAVYPELLALDSRLEGARAYARGAGALANPQLQLAGTLGDADENSNFFRQRVELGGQRGLRSALAELGVRTAAAELANTRRTLAVRAGGAYYGFWQARERLRVGQSRHQLAERLEAIARRRLDAQEIASNEYQLVQLEAARATAQQLDLVAAERIARARLNLYLATPDERALELPASLAAVPEAPAYLSEPLPSLDALQVRAQSLRSDLERARLEAQEAELEADLVGSEMAPELEFAAYRSRLYGAAEQGLQISLLVPLWDWGRVGAQEARQRKRAEALARLVELRRLEIGLEVREAWERYQAVRQKREVLKAQAGHAAGLAQTAQKAYELGFLPLVQVFQAQNAFSDVLLEWLAAEGNFQQTTLELHWISGGDSPGGQP